MVTAACVTMLSWIVNWGNMWGGLPFSWTRGSKQGKFLQVHPSKWVHIKWFSFILYTCMYLLYLIARAIHETLYGDVISASKIIVYVLCMLGLSVLIFSTLLKENEITFVAN